MDPAPRSVNPGHEATQESCFGPSRTPSQFVRGEASVYHDGGGTATDPFDFTEAPVMLCPRNAYARVTTSAAYTAGERFFAGVAALTSPAALTGWMGEFYRAHLDRPVTTLDLETHLVARSGKPEMVDAFHRWVYGFPDPSPAPDLWLRDAPGHTGTEACGGRFWDSPDLWIRNHDDGGLTHQAPIADRDNWFYARVRNQGPGVAHHFLITFHVKLFAGVQFTWPTDFLPAIAAAGGFDLGPGDQRIVRARWPAAHVSHTGTHACWLAAILARSDRPSAGTHVWEHGNLAQKNLTIATLKRRASIVLPIVARGRFAGEERVLELIRPTALVRLDAAILPKRALPTPALPPADVSDALEHGHLPRRPSRGFLAGKDRDALVAAGFDLLKQHPFPEGPTARLSVRLPLGQTSLGLVLRAGDTVLPGRGTIDLVTRDADGRVLGGAAIELTVE